MGCCWLLPIRDSCVPRPTYVTTTSHLTYMPEKCSQDILYEALEHFGRLVQVSIKSAADRKSRDALSSYIRTTFGDELSGVFQLVSLWKPIGGTVWRATSQVSELTCVLATSGWTSARCHQECCKSQSCVGFTEKDEDCDAEDRRYVSLE